MINQNNEDTTRHILLIIQNSLAREKNIKYHRGTYKDIKYHRGIKILQKKKEKIVTLGLRLKSHHFSLVIINI